MAPHAEHSPERSTIPENGHTTTHDHQEGQGERNMPSSVDYVHFEHLPPGGPLNRWSHFMTRDHDFPGAQVGSFALFFSSQLPKNSNFNSRCKPAHHVGHGVCGNLSALLPIFGPPFIGDSGLRGSMCGA
ncbi:hypothetical protein QBC35DRAFT_386580 [Podospora australis]|uniref:Uncharacterized protein n=1 Tax=Podospora australis TaxID=1536484 RepID=A0AAN6WUV4_9PEZI|nr:hypothetical protein QBC35DRAFT_386580 [Podospora australis]